MRIMDGMNKQQVIIYLTGKVVEAHSQKALAEKIQVTPSFLNDVLMGKRNPTGKILDYLGLEKVTIYRKKETESK